MRTDDWRTARAKCSAAGNKWLSLGALCVAAMALALPPPAWGWWRTIDGTTGSSDVSNAVAVDQSGDIVAAGQLSHDFAVVKLSGSTGAELWRVEINGTANEDDAAHAVAVDSSGDVVAAGYLYNSGTDSDFTVVKLSGSTGVELWRREIDPTGGFGTDVAYSVVVDSSGDVVAAGVLYNGATDRDFAVVKLSGSTGAELWRVRIDGSEGVHWWLNQSDKARSVAVDALGDVVAVGSLQNVDNLAFTVVKLSGAAGAELWRQEITGSGYLALNLGLSVVLDRSGDVIAGGTIYKDGLDTYPAVVKLAGATGAELWRQEIAFSPDAYLTGGDALSVAVDGSGDVIAGGFLSKSLLGADFTVVKLSGSTGEDLWRRRIDGTAGRRAETRPWTGRRETAASVVVDSSGDVVAAGRLYNRGTLYDFTVVKLSASTGAKLWQREIEGTAASEDEALSVVVDDAGDAVAVGYLNNTQTGDDFAVVKLPGQDGLWGTHWVSGRLLWVRDNANDSVRRRIEAKSKDPEVSLPLLGSDGDPTLYGGQFRILNPFRMESVTFTLPAGSWKPLGDPPGSKGYKYTDREGLNGPCERIAIKREKFAVTCTGRNGTIPFTLDEPTQGMLVVSLQSGSQQAWCVSFGGNVLHDHGTRGLKGVGIFWAKKSRQVAADCP